MAADPPKPPRKRTPAKKTPAAKTTPAKPVKPPPVKRAPRKATVKPPAKAGRAHLASVTKLPTHRAPGSSSRNPMSPAAIALTERRGKALMLRRAGLSMQQIADRMSQQGHAPGVTYTRQLVSDDVRAMLDGLSIEPARMLLEEELDRLLALQTAVWTKAMAGEVGSVDRVLKIMDARAKYLGLYAPIKQMLIGPDGGAVQISLEDPSQVFDATFTVLDEILPHADPPAMPGDT